LNVHALARIAAGMVPDNGRAHWDHSMDVYWLEQSEADVPEENDWLSPSEVMVLERLRIARRRAQWRLGRWTAKRALAACLDSPERAPQFAKIAIWPAPSGAPQAFFEEKPAALTISISHREERAICAVAGSGVELGCDLELIEPHSDAFVADYFTAEERALVARHLAAEQPRILALLWSGKESALKALGAGLRLDTRSVIVELADAPASVHDWSPFQVSCAGGKLFHGWWQQAERMVRTVVAAPPPASPILLEIDAGASGTAHSNPGTTLENCSSAFSHS